jgi:hypothetical protein
MPEIEAFKIPFLCLSSTLFFFFEQKFSYSSLITKRKILDPQKGSREK